MHQILKGNGLSLVISLISISCGKADFRGRRELGLSGEPVKSSTAEPTNGSRSPTDQSKELENPSDGGKSVANTEARTSDLKPSPTNSGTSDTTDKQKALVECLSSWKNHPFSDQDIDKAKNTAVTIAVRNGNDAELYKDETKTDTPKLILVSISAEHNLNSASVSLLNPNGYYCVSVRAGNNANGFKARYKCDQGAKVKYALSVSQNANGASVECVL